MRLKRYQKLPELLLYFIFLALPSYHSSEEPFNILPLQSCSCIFLPCLLFSSPKIFASFTKIHKLLIHNILTFTLIIITHIFYNHLLQCSFRVLTPPSPIFFPFYSFPPTSPVSSPFSPWCALQYHHKPQSSFGYVDILNNWFKISN